MKLSPSRQLHLKLSYFLVVNDFYVHLQDKVLLQILFSVNPAVSLFDLLCVYCFHDAAESPYALRQLCLELPSYLLFRVELESRWTSHFYLLQNILLFFFFHLGIIAFYVECTILSFILQVLFYQQVPSLLREKLQSHAFFLLLVLQLVAHDLGLVFFLVVS